jgi:heme-degrading monooxygenase HmoA
LLGWRLALYFSDPKPEKEGRVFAVLFEVNPKGEQWGAYLDLARMLRPDLEMIDGFIENIRYRSLTRDGWILSLSTWEGEKALVRWRTQDKHHMVQEQGRNQIFLDYHLRVGQITRDTRLPDGRALAEQRLDETEVGEGTTATLIDVRRPQDWVEEASPFNVAAWLGLVPNASELVSWDVYDAVMSPGDVILLMTWLDQEGADAFAGRGPIPEGARLRQVRVVRDYGMYDRRESPQYYPEVERP